MACKEDSATLVPPARVWVPADRSNAPMLELALPWSGRISRRGFAHRLAQRVLELACRCTADTGVPPARIAARALADARVSLPDDAPPDAVADRLMRLDAMSRLLNRIDWSRSPARPGATTALPANAREAYAHATLADVLALL